MASKPEKKSKSDKKSKADKPEIPSSKKSKAALARAKEHAKIQRVKDKEWAKKLAKEAKAPGKSANPDNKAKPGKKAKPDKTPQKAASAKKDAVATKDGAAKKAPSRAALARRKSVVARTRKPRAATTPTGEPSAGWTMVALRARARESGKRGWSRLRKADLLNWLGAR